jgi:hypothetical protein
MQQRTFFGFLLLATAIPYFAVPLLNLAPDVWALANMLLLIGFLGGGAHVAAGYYFFADRKGRAILLSHWPRTILLPVCLACAYGLIFLLGSQAMKAVALLFYFVWQTWHYQRQNFGVASFCTRAAQQAPLTNREKLPMQLAVIAAILALFKLYDLGQGTVLQRFAQSVWYIGLGLQGLAAVLWLRVAAAIRREEGAARRIAVLGMGTLFFLPSFVYSDPLNAVLSYALAHGLQYLVFMAYVGQGQERKGASLAKLVVLTLSLGGLLVISQARTGSPLREFIFGVYLSVVMTHFVMDGVIWRLRLAPQRAYMTNIFSFIFTKKTTT